jgi:pyruvate formate lyase activating enzyme
MEAGYWQTIEGKGIQCQLCPHNCVIAPGMGGICKMRVNEAGRLISLNYGRIVSSAFDPIEKKPLYHFHPGSKIFSIGSLGCNLRCFFCQNHTISQANRQLCEHVPRQSAEQLVRIAKSRPDNIGMAFTYNEPTVWFEFMLETAKLVKAEGMKTAMITNGFINPEPLAELLPVMDAFNVDLKGFTDSFYQKLGGRLAPVQHSLKQIRAAGRHLEITTLVVPTLNDDPATFTQMVDWIADELGTETILHLSRYFPRYKSPIPITSAASLYRLHDIAARRLQHVHLGNL